MLSLYTEKVKNAMMRIVNVFLNIYRTSTKFRIGFIILVAILIFGSLSIFTPPWSTRLYYLPKNTPPQLTTLTMFLGHTNWKSKEVTLIDSISNYIVDRLTLILGVTSNGRSVFWSLTNAIMNSLGIAIITAMVASHIGLIIGLVAGLKGGLLDRILMFITDTFIVIPAIALYAVLAALLKGMLTLPLLGLLLSISSWPWPARQVRAMTLSLKERDFMVISRLSGMKFSAILFKELMPHVLGWHLINFTNTILFAIGSETGLAILGLSILDKDTLGTMIYWNLHFASLFRGIVWWYLPPIITLIILFASLYLISIGISEYLNPRLRG